MSNTEMVSVPRDKLQAWQERFSKAQIFRESSEVQALLAQPAEQHQGEPVGYQQRTMTDRPGSQWTPWRECCDATRARYSQEVGQFNQHGIMREIRPVFASAADPGELERLRAQLAELEAMLREGVASCYEAAQMAEQIERAEPIRVSTALMAPVRQFKLSDAKGKAGVLKARLIEVAEALSASAEPSAPKCKACGDTGVIDSQEKDELPGGQFVERGIVACRQCAEPIAPVEIDEFEREAMRIAVRSFGYREGEALLKTVLERRGNGTYCVEWVNGALEGWKARAALERQP